MVKHWVVGGAGLVCACTPTERAKLLGQAPAKQEPAAAAPVANEPPSNSRAGSLSVEVVPGFSSVLAGSEGELDVLVRLQAVEAPDKKRPPLDLALIIDHSGSMSGEKMAAAKQAALETVRELAPEDRLTLIAYDDEVTVFTRREPVGDGSAMRAHILKLSDGGGTALGPALRDGLFALQHGGRRGDDVLAHVMLLSDGQANQGESRPNILSGWAANALGHGIAVSTLGVGLDYNEDLMTSIADAGGGRYHFIESGDRVPIVLSAEFAGLSSTVARNIALGVQPSSGHDVREIPGYPNTVVGDVTHASAGSLASGGSREMLVRLHYSTPKFADNVEMAAFTVTFRDVLDDGTSKTVTLRPKLKLTRDPVVASKSENLAVTVRAQEYEVAKTLQAASEQVGDGSFGAANASIVAQRSALEKKARENPNLDLSGMIGELNVAEDEARKAEASPISQKQFTKKNKVRAYKRRKK